MLQLHSDLNRKTRDAIQTRQDSEPTFWLLASIQTMDARKTPWCKTPLRRCSPKEDSPQINAFVLLFPRVLTKDCQTKELLQLLIIHPSPHSRSLLKTTIIKWTKQQQQLNISSPNCCFFQLSSKYATLGFATSTAKYMPWTSKHNIAYMWCKEDKWNCRNSLSFSFPRAKLE